MKNNYKIIRVDKNLEDIDYIIIGMTHSKWNGVIPHSYIKDKSEKLYVFYSSFINLEKNLNTHSSKIHFIQKEYLMYEYLNHKNRINANDSKVTKVIYEKNITNLKLIQLGQVYGVFYNKVRINKTEKNNELTFFN
ncbi:hypothetical protein QI259_10085 [Staphylococcus saprophyticus]|uniref:Uncharacterized protein n=1 Tax=Staphylococcus delphini TaxID=53344 RepID=A0A2A4H071_9STAP|nr:MULTISPECIES: hypothetical protein [Staphylococcus]MDW3990640.1 hypothetical protein [Staphylococcus saprophyticus]PCF56822.1 hypothetical protein B5C08_01950 [Staphylococcus delphini]UTF16951.1 hypothetical protein MNU35_00290 [Staphylococcus epidermidis]HEC2157443.1 hypothetical protein [Staphylococcus delphini]